MSKEEMLKVIYEKIADKTLSFGCRIIRYTEEQTKKEGVFLQTIVPDEYTMIAKVMQKNGVVSKFEDYEFEEIGHPVMIGDVLDFIKQTTTHYDEILSLLESRYEKRKPIDDQSEECIGFIYNLVKDEPN